MLSHYSLLYLEMNQQKTAMAQNIVLRVALPTLLRRIFDYLPPQDIDLTALVPGIRVQVPFQSRTLVGILVSVEQKSSVPLAKLKTALALLDTEAILTPDIDQLCRWAADYYHHALGEVFASALPSLLRKAKPIKTKALAELPSGQSSAALSLNPAQQEALDRICAANGEFKVFLLNGVTGSGKTEIYLRAIEKILMLDKQVLVLVPEISLTPQTIERFRARFSVPVVALHSGLSEQERLQAWLSARSGIAKIVIGTRSAILTSMANLGLIIVDEEHDTSFKQQDRFRYHARDLAIKRASINQIPIVLGSATPSLESLLNVQRQRYVNLSLPQRAGDASLPSYRIVDLRQSPADEGLSAVLLQAMKEHLAQGNQVMLFLNRRGFAPVLYCTQCAWIAECKRCDTRMVYHRTPVGLRCHHCDARRAIPMRCDECGQAELQPVGLGTQRLEQTLMQHFPQVPIIRVDRDTTKRKGKMQDLLTQINTQEPAILLGTQMLAKGHHFPQVTLVGVVDADSGLFSADFRAAEQMGQLLLQVSGRAGRAEKPGTVVIQTRHPDHPLLQTLTQQGYQPFSEALLKEREQALLPPYAYFAVFRAESYKDQSASDFLHSIKNACQATASSVITQGPAPALLAKRKGLYCQHLLLKSNHRGQLQQHLQMLLQKIETLAAAKSVKWVLDVDPVDV